MSKPSKALLIALFAVSVYAEAAGAQNYSDPVITDSDASIQQATPTPDPSQTYIALQYGYNDPVANTRQMDETDYYSGAIGKRYDNYRIEAELSYRNNETNDSTATDIDTTEFKTYAAMVNLFYDFRSKSRITPYIGAGIGAAYASANINFDNGIDTLNVNDDAMAIIYHVGGGVSVDITKNIALTAGYRYVDTGKYEFATTVNGVDVGQVDAGDYRAHELNAGVRYSF